MSLLRYNTGLWSNFPLLQGLQRKIIKFFSKNVLIFNKKQSQIIVLLENK
jgi:hypothetical protein